MDWIFKTNFPDYTDSLEEVFSVHNLIDLNNNRAYPLLCRSDAIW